MAKSVPYFRSEMLENGLYMGRAYVAKCLRGFLAGRLRGHAAARLRSYGQKVKSLITKIQRTVWERWFSCLARKLRVTCFWWPSLFWKDWPAWRALWVSRQKDWKRGSHCRLGILCELFICDHGRTNDYKKNWLSLGLCRGYEKNNWEEGIQVGSVLVLSLWTEHDRVVMIGRFSDELLNWSMIVFDLSLLALWFAKGEIFKLLWRKIERFFRRSYNCWFVTLYASWLVEWDIFERIWRKIWRKQSCIVFSCLYLYFLRFLIGSKSLLSVFAPWRKCPFISLLVQESLFSILPKSANRSIGILIQITNLFCCSSDTMPFILQSVGQSAFDFDRKDQMDHFLFLRMGFRGNSYI